MRNGLNTGNMSELVHEIRVSPKEAQFRYGVATTLDCAGRAHGRVQTLAAGSIRVARPFELRTSAVPSDLSTPEQLLVALGGCAMITFLLGCSARAVSLSGLAMELRAEAPASGPLRRVAYDLSVDADVDSSVIASLARHVACFSPNHRTFIDANELHATLAVRRPDGRWERAPLRPPAPAATEAATAVSARLEWQYGTQLRAETRREVECWVDQPKQALGLDRAPNPQEYLLGALNAELVLRAAPALVKSQVVSSGKLDLRGLLNVEHAVPARVHELELALELASELPFAELQTLAERALADANAHQTIVQPSAVDVTVLHNARRIDGFASDQQLVREQLSQLERARAH